MFGYFFNANYVKESTFSEIYGIWRKRKTYQAWYGIEDPEKLRNDRTFNPAGMYFDENGNMQFYDNETDNYWQNHFQLHWTEKWTEKKMDFKYRFTLYKKEKDILNNIKKMKI